MNAERRAVLITRPEPGASETLAPVAALGFEPILAPALVVRRLRRLSAADLDGAQAAVLTSAAAARAAVEDLDASARSRISAFCVGERTAAAARQAGFGRVEIGAGRAEDLPALLRGVNPAGGAVLLLRGREVAYPLAAELGAMGLSLRDLALYGADPAEALPQEATKALRDGRVAAALLLSARTVEAFQALPGRDTVSQPLGDVVAVCNSARTAAPARKSGLWSEVLTAEEPTLDATLALLREL